MWAKHQQSGFTIVELLIVIVVIAVLASITIVAYNGIQNRANDATVRRNLSDISKKYELYKIDNNIYPYGGSLNTGVAIKLNINQSAYDLTKHYQLLNCTNIATPGSDYAVLAVSKSGKRFYVSSVSGSVIEYSGADTWLELAVCPNVLSGSTGNGAGYDNVSGWRTWTVL